MTHEEAQIKRQELCGEFWLDLREVVCALEGDPAIIEVYMDAPLSEFVDLMAPNGIRPVLKRAGHINNHHPSDKELDFSDDRFQ